MNGTTQTTRKEEYELLKQNLWNKDKDEVFKAMEVYSDEYLIEFTGYNSHGDLDESSDATMSIDWGTSKFWEEDNYSENGWRAYFSPEGAALYHYLVELGEKRQKEHDATKNAEEQQVEHEQDLNMESNMGLVEDTKGADGGYLGR